MGPDLKKELDRLNADVERCNKEHERALAAWNKRETAETTKAVYSTDEALQQARRRRDAVQRRLQEAGR